MARIILVVCFALLLAGCNLFDSPYDSIPAPSTPWHSPWQWQNCYPTHASLSGVYALDSLQLWAVGSYGTLLHSADGGSTWEAQTPPFGDVNYGFVAFTDAQHGWALGEYHVLHTTNGGTTWLFVAMPDTTRAERIAALRGDLCYVLDYNGRLLATTDDGATWASRPTPSSYHPLTMYFLNPDTGWVSTSYPWSIYHTTDGGITWAQQPVTLQSPVSMLQFYDALHGWAGGQEMILYTSDGGLTWSAPEATSPSIYSIATLGPHEAWAPSYRGIGHTLDGLTWNWLPLSANQYALAVAFSDPRHGWAVGGGGIVLHTTDGGQTWPQQSNQMWDNLYDVDFVNAQVGWAVGEHGAILHTTDRGVSWSVQTADSGAWLRAVCAVDSDYAWAGGRDGVLFATTDGGTHWQTQSTGVTTDIWSIAFADRNHGWVASAGWGYQSGHMLHTSDGGISWNEQITALMPMRALCCTDALHAWAVGDSGKVVRTTDGGNSWTESLLPGAYGNGSYTEDGISFVDPLHGWIASYSQGEFWSGIYRTTNGGETWASQLDSSGFWDISMSDSLTGYALGFTSHDRGIFATYSGGRYWTPVHEFYGRALDFPEPGQGWIVAEEGTILHYGD